MGNRLAVDKHHCSLWEDKNAKLSDIRSGVSGNPRKSPSQWQVRNPIHYPYSASNI